MQGVWDWAFFWDAFEFFMKTVAPFLMLIVAVVSVGLLLLVVIRAVRNGRDA
ncbi:hypothetical protein [Gracilibacillus lacisalsi]|uniref:hypothetical protein n=1 Tax=Gracilibacillus lacisalsi TaxID=393087 RepID=UPI000369A722|nr:hypothetical protein [Gracilibacillus lacisalsi]